MRLLNVGCGSHFHPGWINIDIVSSSPEVIAFDIKRGLPFHDKTFDAVYHSHLLEHLPYGDARVFMQEAVRVLKPSGIVRVVTPDLEGIVRMYLDKLDSALNNIPGAEDDYDWMVLELLDQTVRNESGGEMGRYLSRPDLRNKEFIASRIGVEADNFWNSEKQYRDRSFRNVIAEANFSTVFTRLRNFVARELAGLIAGGKCRRVFQSGLFRESGEIHLWMYDRYSLGRLMDCVGLVNITKRNADDSMIPDFNSYGLDVIDDRVRKPDSLFMEGTKLERSPS